MANVDDPTRIVVAHAPLDDVRDVSGGVTTGSVTIGDTDTMTIGVWEHSVGVSTDTENDEVFVVLSGRGRILLPDGSVLGLAPGTVGRLLAGEQTRWEIDEPLRKVWVSAHDR
ncbi:MAG: cupin domain-containing protein [Actinomycetota bacterium]|nr:cupin domain-containing protein [Actinomycetota bacterium]